MKTTNIVLATILFCAVSNNAGAEASQFRKYVGARSQAAGLGRTSVAAVRRGASAGRDIVISGLLREFADEKGSSGVRTSGPVGIESTRERMVATGQGWFLEVMANGDWVHYRDTGDMNVPSGTGIGLEAKPTLESLRRLGAAFIRSRLASIVLLGPGETLEPWYTAHAISISAALGEVPKREIISSKIVFSRAIDGIPVVGNGSKVVIHFSVDGKVTGFDVDWSPLQRVGAQRGTLGLAEIRERAAVIHFAKVSGNRSTNAADKFECGYFDVGARSGVSSEELQAACISTHDSATKRLDDPPSVEVIPAGTVVNAAEYWPNTTFFASR